MEFVFIALKIEIVLLLSCNKDIESPGGVLDISLGGEVRRGPSYPDPV